MESIEQKSILEISTLSFNTALQINQDFQDDEFPPTLSSIFDIYDPKLNEKDIDIFSRLIWVRASELKKYHINNHPQEINPGDIMQGSLGNCTYLSALSSLAQYPERIKNIFVSQETHGNGFYLVKLFVNGIPQTIALDEYVPTDPKTDRPAFAQNAGNKLWVIFLEKAWAKIHGNYHYSQARPTHIAFSFLTGAPCFHYDNENDHALWNKIVEADRQMHIITASCSSSENSIEKERIGLVTDHAYSVISVHAVQVNGREQKLMKLRNPWGRKEWQGNWSRHSSLWTVSLRQQLGQVHIENGEFFIAFEDYKKYFDQTSICAYQEWNKRSYITAKQKPNSYSMFQFAVPESINGTNLQIYISVYQLYKSFTYKILGSGDYQYAYTRIIVGKIDQNNDKFPVQFVGATSGQDYQICLDLSLQPGVYCVYVECDFQYPELKNELCISTYAVEQIDLIEVEPQIQFLTNSLKSCAFQISQRKYYPQIDNKNVFNCFSLNDSNCDYGYLYIQNDSESQIRKSVRFNVLDGYTLLEPYNSQTIEFIIAPFSSEIIILKPIGNTHRSVQWSSDIQEIYSNEQLKAYAIKNGKFSQINSNDQYYDIYQYYGYFKTNGGYLFVQNKSPNTTFIGIYNFKLQNLIIVNENYVPQPTNLKIVLTPEETKLLRLEIQNPHSGSQFNFSQQYKCIEMIDEDQSQLVQKAKTFGKKHQIKEYNQYKLIYYYIYKTGGSIYWYFENLEIKRCSFYCQVQFNQLQNLKLDNNSNKWEVILQNGEHMMLKMEEINPLDILPTNYSFTTNVIINDY